MARKKFKLEIVRYFRTEKQAIQAARRACRTNGSEATVFCETTTDSGQCFDRVVIWKDGASKAVRP